jgi:electron transfer flavoprotein beta subunit
MRFVVCLKQVLDTSAILQVRPGLLEPHQVGVLPVVNPYDEFALEAALRLREQRDSGDEVILLMLSRELVDESVFHGLAMGADRAVILRQKQEQSLDSLTSAALLSDYLCTLEADLIFCGECAVDSGAYTVGPAIAARLEVPQVTGIEDLSLDSNQFRARCRGRDGVEIVSFAAPAVLTFLRGSELPRYPSLDDIFMAGDKGIEEVPVSIAAHHPRTRRISLSAPFEQRSGELLDDDGSAVAIDGLLDRIAKSVHVL